MDRWKMRSIGVVAVLALALGAGHLVRIHDRGTEGDGLAEGDAASFAEERRRPTVIEWIKRRLRRRAGPAWRQYYPIYTKDAAPPAWAKALAETSAIQ
nr:hypothetical protein [Gemmatimonadales bacterium]